MTRYRNWGLALLVPALAYVVVASGCGGGGTAPTQGGKPATTEATKPTTPQTAKDDKGSERKELANADWDGVLKGKVTYDGDPPAVADFKSRVDGLQNAAEKEHCLKGDVTDPTWKVDKDKGVANVVVWIKPPEGVAFKKHPDDKKTWKDAVGLDQPFCAFEPHVFVMYPSSLDAKTRKQVPTGQTVTVKNSATILHNTNFKGSSLRNPGKNITLKSKEEEKLDIKPDSVPIIFSCDVHKWMTAYGWAFDHPYAAVTNEKGEYEIKNVPTGAEVHVVGWHEQAEFFGEGGNKGKAVTLKKGDNTVDFKIKKK